MDLAFWLWVLDWISRSKGMGQRIATHAGYIGAVSTKFAGCFNVPDNRFVVLDFSSRLAIGFFISGNECWHICFAWRLCVHAQAQSKCKSPDLTMFAPAMRRQYGR